MITTKTQYIQRLRHLLKDHPDRDVIVYEIEGHAEELLEKYFKEEMYDNEAMVSVQKQLGTPEQLADGFKHVSSRNSEAVKRTFILVNFLFFATGGSLALGAAFSDLLHMIWQLLAQSAWFILAVYSGYWAFIGFEIGKEYGAKGKALLVRTIGTAIIPNFILMLITLFGMLPFEVFQSLLNSSFLIGCLIATFFFFPISKIGYYMGVRKVF